MHKTGMPNDMVQKAVTLNRLIETVAKISAQEKAPIIKKVAKLGEEYGEICAAVLAEDGYKYSTDSIGSIRANLREECIDLLIMNLDIMVDLGMSVDDINTIFIDKCQQWQDKISKKKLQ